MEILLISFAAFAIAILTFFSGFGLGTLLTPVFMVFFPTEIAIGLTGLVHLLNNIFKLILVGKHASKMVLFRFGLPAAISAFFGAWLLLHIPDSKPLFSYFLGEKKWEVYPVKFTIALLLLFFVLFDFIPWLKKISFDKKYLPIGGLISGFFGGLSGNQGALRSAFLVKTDLTKEVFIGTTIIVSCFVDFTRLSVYATMLPYIHFQDNLKLMACTSISAMGGSLLGNLWLKKVTFSFLKIIISIFLICLSIAFGAGWL